MILNKFRLGEVLRAAHDSRCLRRRWACRPDYSDEVTLSVHTTRDQTHWKYSTMIRKRRDYFLPISRLARPTCLRSRRTIQNKGKTITKKLQEINKYNLKILSSCLDVEILCGVGSRALRTLFPVSTPRNEESHWDSED